MPERSMHCHLETFPTPSGVTDMNALNAFPSNDVFTAAELLILAAVLLCSLSVAQSSTSAFGADVTSDSPPPVAFPIAFDRDRSQN